jgi:hypothetical protein
MRMMIASNSHRFARSEQDGKRHFSRKNTMHQLLSPVSLEILLELLTFGKNMAFTLSRDDDAKRIARIAGKMVLDFIDSTNECFVKYTKRQDLDTFIFHNMMCFTS